MRIFTCTATSGCWNCSGDCSVTSRFTTASVCTSRWAIARRLPCTERGCRPPGAEDPGSTWYASAWHAGAVSEAWLRGPRQPRKAPGFAARGRSASARRRSGYPLAGCTPAELTSVSPDKLRLSQPATASQGQRLATCGSGQDGPREVAKDSHFLV